MSPCELRFIFYHALEERNGFVRIAFCQPDSRVEEASPSDPCYSFPESL